MSNTGTYTDSVKVNGSGTMTHKVCNAGSTVDCSNQTSTTY